MVPLDKELKPWFGSMSSMARVCSLSPRVHGITNTPFTVLVEEPSTCTAQDPAFENLGVVATHVAPATSLRSFDAVCVASDKS